MIEYTDKQINSMIRHLKVKDIAEIQYIDRQIKTGVVDGLVYENDKETGDLTYYDYKSNSHLTLSQLIASAIETGWEENGK